MSRPRPLAGLVALVACLASCSPAPGPGDLAGWNVVLVTIDTLRADRVGFAGFDGASTPTLDRLAGEGVVFERAVAAAPVTLPSHATILTGLYPPRHGALDNGFYSLPDDVPTLATILREAGWQTGAVVGAYVLHGQFGLDRGFESYDDRFRQPRTSGKHHRERSAERVTDSALAWLAARDGRRPFLLWAHYYDPHAPYDPPPPYRGRFVTRPYDGEIAYADAQIGRLLEGIAALPGAERTLVVVTADHGEAFGDGGETTHGLLLRESTLRVPFLLWAPGAVFGGRRVSEVASGADVAPTVLDLLGVPPPAPLDGRSLVPALSGREADGERFVYSETRLPRNMHGWAMLAGVRDESWAWVRAPRPELYDLAEDPHETVDRSDALPDLRDRLDERVGAVLGSSRAPDERRALPEEEIEALRALGYAFGAEPPAPSGYDPKDMLPLWNEMNALRDVMSRGAHAEALAGFERLLERDPGNVELHMLRGQCLVQVGRAEEGIREFRGLFEAGIARGRSGTIFAKTLADAGHAGEAEALLRTFVRIEPEYSEHSFNLGVLLSGEGRKDEAIEAYETALAGNPEAIHVLANLASLLASERPDTEGDRAVELAERAVALSPEDDRPRLVLIDVLSEAGRPERAQAEIDALVRKRHLAGITREELAEAVREHGDRTRSR